MVVEIISLGYEKRSIDEMIKILSDYKVTKLIDIRETPISRRKDFNKKKLSSHLEQAGIVYLHFHQAGNPHRKETSDIKHCLQLYARYLKRNPGVIDRINTELNGEPVAVMCYEREHKNCHRSILIHELQEHDHSIQVIKVN